MARRFTGFTLIEMVTVLAIIIILIALLVPNYNAVRDVSKLATCASNLHQINAAAVNHKIDNRDEPLRSASWPGQLNNYLNNQLNVFICPSDDDPDRTGPPLAAIDIFCPWCNPPMKYLHTMMFQEGPVVLLGGTPRPKDGKIMGNPPVDLGNGLRKYELWFEDIPKAMNPDYDIDDFIVEVTELPGNRHKIYARKGNAGFRFNVVNGNGDLLFANVGSSGVTFELSGGTASYGMNRELDGLENQDYASSTIFMLDYQKIQAVVNDNWVMRDDWDIWLTSDGKMPFARHQGKCNVLGISGDVSRMFTTELDPEIDVNLRKWMPGFVP